MVAGFTITARLPTVLPVHVIVAVAAGVMLVVELTDQPDPTHDLLTLQEPVVAKGGPC